MEPLGGQSGRVAAGAAGGARILVVDDDEAIRKLIAKRLAHAGYDVAEATNGQRALQAVGEGPVDLVVLDLMMPELDGYRTLERLRASYSFAALPVIILSAKDDRDDVISALRLGANDYAIKPPDFELLLNRVRVHLDLKRAADKRVGPYRLIRQIGAGGMGIVFEAEDTRHGTPVALKVLPRAQTLNPEFITRFLREAHFAAQVQHPNIVRLLEAGRDGEIYFIAMELVRGVDLAEVRERRVVPWREVLQIGRQVAKALAVLKDLGIIHRDVKPENVILATDGTAKLTDFGVARDVADGKRLTEAGLGIGSVAYASPEQISGRGDHRSDIYSLGCTMYFLLTGRDAFSGHEPLDSIVRQKAQVVPVAKGGDIPVGVSDLVRKMMQPRPERRFQYYHDLVLALDDTLSGTSRPRHRPTFALAIAGLVLAAAVALWRALSWG